jgi:mitogen-activated protein kinase 1/3
VLGYPQEEDLEYVKNEHTLAYLKKVPRPKEPIKWAEKFPEANPFGLDLLQKMLRFDPGKRITIEEAIEHPYFSMF